MDIIISGYGRMGKEVEQVVINRGHNILATIDDASGWESLRSVSLNSSVVIDFSVPETVLDVYKFCFQHQLPVVSGTTGWLVHWDEVIADCQCSKGTFFYASNFSLGVNIFFHLNQQLAHVMGKLDNYKPRITETHHIHKLDAPSGTAITLANHLIENNPTLKNWTLDSGYSSEQLPIISFREREVPGIHEVSYESEEDVILIKHSAKNRRGFALGAVLAAEFIHGKTGIYSMKEMMKDLI